MQWCQAQVVVHHWFWIVLSCFFVYPFEIILSVNIFIVTMALDNKHDKSSTTPLLPQSQTLGRTLHHATAMMINGGELKYKLLRESYIQVCRISHGSNVVNKLLNLKFMRRWESHNIVLGESTIFSRTVSQEGCMKYDLHTRIYIVLKETCIVNLIHLVLLWVWDFGTQWPNEI